MRHLMPHAAAVLSFSVLAACGSGGGGTTAPTVTITSPVEGDRITGSSTLAVTGTVKGDGVTSVTVSTNGGTAVAATLSGTSFTAEVTLDAKDNAILATATGAGKTGSATMNVFFPFLSLGTFQPASLVIGQANFTSTSSSDGLDGLSEPYGDPAWDGSHLFLSDDVGGRVLVFDGLPTSSGATASFALDAVNAGTGSASPLSGPGTVRVSGDKLLVGDFDDNRVVILDAIPTATGAAASVVVGQPDLVSISPACSASGLYGPESFFVAGGKLIVADSYNNRVLVWNTLPTAPGSSADLVLGQAGFTSCDENRGASSPSASTLDYPTDVWSDGTRLVVVDFTNNRILGWNAFPTEDGQQADFVLGQADFTTGTCGSVAQQDNVCGPYFVASNGNQLFVADSGDNRVLVWSSLPSASGALPDLVLGQGDFTHATVDDDDQDGADDGAPTARTMGNPNGITVLDDALLVADDYNLRYLVFR